MVTMYGPQVRVRHSMLNHTLYVEQLVNDEWQQVRKFDEMSNGYAHTEAHQCALRTRRNLMENEHAPSTDQTRRSTG